MVKYIVIYTIKITIIDIVSNHTKTLIMAL